MFLTSQGSLLARYTTNVYFGENNTHLPINHKSQKLMLDVALEHGACAQSSPNENGKLNWNESS